ncbi:MAG TPA: hypothetical protein DCL54_14985 [Alphaproteobacteria bacterium]|nr:hypothetical protein [Alphaproteobacteria bacterium]HAJ47877.1 hypothetical protein [Alphaproteobacteria bacterium]
MTSNPFLTFQASLPPRLVFLCDHAGREVPEGYGTLGLPRGAFDRHIAYDIGAAALTRALAERLEAPAFLGRYSRLFIDLNRGADDPTLVMKLSDGQIIPGNAHADSEEVSRRIAFAHAPYHARISKCLEDAEAQGIKPIILSIHSFTPTWRGQPRPWDFAILSARRDRRLADPMLAALRAIEGLTIGDNQPYSGELENDTLSVHGLAMGLPHALIEVRQDLIDTNAGVEAACNLLVPVIMQAIANLYPNLAGVQLMDDRHREQAEAAAFRRLVAHLRARSDVQNIDLMTLAGFCRNCLGDWYAEAATASGHTMDKAAGREHVYGMPYAEWKAKHQAEATPEQLAAFAQAQKAGH